jgi:hypothetical protein
MADGDEITIRVTVTAEVVDKEALTAAALAALAEATTSGDEEVDLEAVAALRAAVPDDPSAAIVTLVDPESPLADIPGVELTSIDVEVGTDLDERHIELP